MFEIPWFVLCLCLVMAFISIPILIGLLDYIKHKPQARVTVIDLLFADNCRQVLAFISFILLALFAHKLFTLTPTISLGLLVTNRFLFMYITYTWCASGWIRYAYIRHLRRMNDIDDRHVHGASRLLSILIALGMITFEVMGKLWLHGTVGIAMSYKVRTNSFVN